MFCQTITGEKQFYGIYRWSNFTCEILSIKGSSKYLSEKFWKKLSAEILLSTKYLQESFEQKFLAKKWPNCPFSINMPGHLVLILLGHFDFIGDIWIWIWFILCGSKDLSFEIFILYLQTSLRVLGKLRCAIIYFKLYTFNAKIDRKVL